MILIFKHKLTHHFKEVNGNMEIQKKTPTSVEVPACRQSIFRYKVYTLFLSNT